MHRKKKTKKQKHFYWSKYSSAWSWATFLRHHCIILVTGHTIGGQASSVYMRTTPFKA